MIDPLLFISAPGTSQVLVVMVAARKEAIPETLGMSFRRNKNDQLRKTPSRKQFHDCQIKKLKTKSQKKKSTKSNQNAFVFKQTVTIKNIEKC